MYKIIKNHPVISFFTVTLLWSIGCWTWKNDAKYAIYLGLAAPGIWAIILTAFIYGLSGLRDLFRPIFYWRVNPLYYLLIFVGSFFLLAAISLISAKPLQIPISIPVWKMPVLILVVIILAILYEEIGWRGFALPKLMRKTNGLYASLILGGIWVIWHLVLIYTRDPNISVSAVSAYVAYLISMALIFNWFYFKTGGSLLIVGMLHGVLDAYQLLFFSVLTSSSGAPNNKFLLITVVVLALLTVPFLWRQKQSASTIKYYD